MNKACEEKFATETWSIWGPQFGFPFHKFKPDENQKKCIVVYESSHVTKDQIRNLNECKQRHFIQTSKGTKQRICLTHLNENCIARGGMIIEQDGFPLQFDLDCVVDWEPNKNQPICSLHERPCFAAVNFKCEQDLAISKLTCATIDMLKVLKVDSSWLTNEIDNILFALDHIHVNLEPVAFFVCRPWRLLFAECNGDIDKFLAASIHPVIWNFDQKLLITRAIKQLWYSFDRNSSQCYIANCVCKSIDQETKKSLS